MSDYRTCRANIDMCQIRDIDLYIFNGADGLGRS